MLKTRYETHLERDHIEKAVRPRSTVEEER